MRRVGLLGYGLAGRVFHAPIIGQTVGLSLSTIVTSDPARAADAAREVPGARVAGNADAVFEGRERADVVVVATGNAAHVPLARRAVRAGIPVVVDKPLAPRAEEGRGLVRAAADAGVPLTVFHNRRWDDDFLTLRSLLDSGRVGTVHRFESRFERWAPDLRAGSWRERADPAQGGGLLLDLGSHLVDQAIVLFGPVASVTAELDRRRAGSEVDDDVFVSLTHAGGVRSHLWASAVAARPGPRFRVLGSRAGFTCDGLDPQEQQLKDGLRPGDPSWGSRPDGAEGMIGVLDDLEAVTMTAGSYETFYDRLVVALDGGGPLPVDPSDAVAVLEVLEAARTAAASRTVVVLGDGASESHTRG